MHAFLIGLHGGIRWIVVLVGLIAIVKFLIGWLGNMKFGPVDKGLGAAYTISLDINLLLGIIIFVIGLFNDLPSDVLRIRGEHFVVMLLAVVAAHMTSRWKKAEDKIRFRQSALFILLSMILVYVGVFTVGGWG